MASNGVQIGLGVAVALVLGAGIVLLVPTPETGPAEDSATAAARQPPAPAPAPDPAPDPQPQQAAAPRFDTFRIEPDGAAVIAGRAGPGQAVDILLDGAALIRVTTDASGSFAALVTLDPSDQARVLQLMADPDGAALRSEQTVMVAPFGVARAVAEAPLVVGAVTDPGAQAPSPDTAAAGGELADGTADRGVSAVPPAPDSDGTLAELPVDGAAGEDDRGGDGPQTDIAGLADAPQTQDVRADSAAPLVAAEDSPLSEDADPVALAQPQSDLPQTDTTAPASEGALVAATSGDETGAPEAVDQAGLTGADGGADGAVPAPAGQDVAMAGAEVGRAEAGTPPAEPLAQAAGPGGASDLDAAGQIPDDATAFSPESAELPNVAGADAPATSQTPAPPVALVDPPAFAGGAAGTGQSVATATGDSAPLRPDATVTAAADPAPAQDTAPAADTGPGPDGPGVTLTSPAAPQVLVADQDGIRVLPRPEAMTEVALDTITYDSTGEVVLAGRAPGAGSVRVYIDNQPVTTSRIAEGGDWRTDLPDIETGIYTLRIDEIDSAGAVVSRIETPFKREEPEAVSAVMAEQTAQEGFRIAVRTVQPGATLWAIAEEELGAGIRYVAVYEANRDLIRDPDLIYPGQVFRIPDAEE